MDQKSWFEALKVYRSIPVIRVGKLVYINTRYTRPADRFSELFIDINSVKTDTGAWNIQGVCQDCSIADRY